MGFNFYELLSLERTATKEEIEKRYRSIQVRLRANDQSTQGLVRYLNHIYKVLTEERDTYDMYLRQRDLEKAGQAPEPQPGENRTVKAVVDFAGRKLRNWLEGLGNGSG